MVKRRENGKGKKGKKKKNKQKRKSEKVIEVQYCITHEETCLTFFDIHGRRYHERQIPYGEVLTCFGVFASCAPPEPMNDEEWELLLDVMEGTQNDRETNRYKRRED